MMLATVLIDRWDKELPDQVIIVLNGQYRSMWFGVLPIPSVVWVL